MAFGRCSILKANDHRQAHTESVKIAHLSDTHLLANGGRLYDQLGFELHHTDTSYTIEIAAA